MQYFSTQRRSEAVSFSTAVRNGQPDGGGLYFPAEIPAIDASLADGGRGLDRAGDKAMRFERELRNLRNKWGDALIDDPYYNPVLSLDPVPFSALAWPPRRRAPRLNLPPRPVNLPPGF